MMAGIYTSLLQRRNIAPTRVTCTSEVRCSRRGNDDGSSSTRCSIRCELADCSPSTSFYICLVCRFLSLSVITGDYQLIVAGPCCGMDVDQSDSFKLLTACQNIIFYRIISYCIRFYSWMLQLKHIIMQIRTQTSGVAFGRHWSVFLSC